MPGNLTYFTDPYIACPLSTQIMFWLMVAYFKLDKYSGHAFHKHCPYSQSHHELAAIQMTRAE